MQAKVWNDNVHPFTDPDFKGTRIHIEPKQFIEMEYNEALEFRGKYSPIKLGGDGEHLAEGFKMIRVEPMAGDAPKSHDDDTYPCHSCGLALPTKKALDLHIDEQHLDSLVDTKIAETRRKAGRPKKEDAA